MYTVIKYQVTVHFSVDEEFMTLIPHHRVVINELIEQGTIDSYAISAEVGRGWIIMNARNKKSIHEMLKKSPLYKYFELEIDQLLVYDSPAYRFPKVLLN
ncbi:MAG: muconolactone Delta-isomerase family protein [Leadbetterella sp.]